MHKLLSGLALVALVAGAAQAKPEGDKGGRQGGGNPHAVSGGGGGPGNGKVRGGGGGGDDRRARAAAQGGGQPQMMRPVRQEQARGADRGARRAERQPQRQIERRDRRAERQVQRQPERQERRVERQQERRVERQVERRENRQAQREVRRDDRQAERSMRRDDRRDERTVLRANQDFEGQPRFSGRGRALVDGCPPGLAKKNNGCMPPGLAAKSGINTARALTAAAGTSLLASSLSPSWFGYDDYGSDYRYYDGYLLRTSGDSVLGYVPLLGGALAPGRPWLASFQPAPIPAYWNDFYDLGPVDRYRYYDDVLYQLDPGYSEIEDIVALMAGDPWGVGQPMPYGYDVYNVPYSYRARYYDTSDHWYRYSDGYIYDVDPTTRLVQAVVQLLGGGGPLPGQPWLASYQATPIPAYYNDYYGLETPDRYRYYDDVIYELDDGYSEIDSIVAITAGDSWSVGDRMPYGYDVYNVPYAYRDRYYDRPDHLYRYSDGYIYDIDPTTRLVLAAVQLLA
jgi:hypothetical protein